MDTLDTLNARGCTSFSLKRVNKMPWGSRVASEDRNYSEVGEILVSGGIGGGYLMSKAGDIFKEFFNLPSSNSNSPSPGPTDNIDPNTNQEPANQGLTSNQGSTPNQESNTNQGSTPNQESNTNHGPTTNQGSSSNQEPANNTGSDDEGFTLA